MHSTPPIPASIGDTLAVDRGHGGRVRFIKPSRYMVDICRYGRYMIYVEFTIWLINSLPWKITIFNRKIIYKWTIYTMAMLNNQRVLGL